MNDRQRKFKLFNLTIGTVAERARRSRETVTAWLKHTPVSIQSDSFIEEAVQEMCRELIEKRQKLLTR